MRETRQCFKRNVKGFIAGMAFIFIGLLLMPQTSVNSIAATDEAKAIVKEELKEMVLTADETHHDVLKYKLTWKELYAIWTDLETGDCYDAVNCYDTIAIQTTRSGNYISTIYLYMQFGSSFEENFATFNAKTQEILSGLQSGMTDADKALYIHDEIDKITSYKNIGYASYHACGPLVYGQAMCEGYANAYIYLLSKAGITAYEGGSNSMNHAWVYVKLDGEFYNVDITWDDTRRTGSTLNGAFDHKYFLRTDSEFTSMNHYSFYCIGHDDVTATSSKYSNSFIHSVAGSLYYYDGYWYYADGSSVKCATLTDSTGNEVFTASGNVQLVSITDGIISYKVGSTDYTYNLVMGSNEKTEEATVEEQTINANIEESATSDSATTETSTNTAVTTTETTAKYYLVKEGGSRTNYKASNYISLGAGTIKEAVKIQNDSDAIEANLGTVPDYSSYVTENNYIEWYSIKKENDGWHVDGQIMTKETTTDDSTEAVSPENVNNSSEDTDTTEDADTEENADTEEDVDTQEDTSKTEDSEKEDTTSTTTNTSTNTSTSTSTTTTGITAKYYLVKEGGSRTNYSSSNYIRLGSGTIKEAIRIKDNEEAILAILLDIPDYSKYVKDGYHVEWYSVKKEADGWHVDGEIIKDEIVEEVEEEEVEEEVEEVVETVVEATNETTEEATEENTEATETETTEIDFSTCTVAKFYLAKGSRTNYSASNYISLGNGYIVEAVKIQNDEEAIIANLAQIPDYSSYLTENQRVEWYSIKKEADGWHVDGQIVSE